jgi:hypothetical protein
MKLSLVALTVMCLAGCMTFTSSEPVPDGGLDLQGLLPLQVVGGLLGTVTGLVSNLVGCVVPGILKGVLGGLVAGGDCNGLLGLNLEGLVGLDLITGLLGTVLKLVTSVPAALLGILPCLNLKDAAGDIVPIPGGLPIDASKLPTDPLAALQLACPLLGVLGALIGVLAGLAKIAVGVVGAVLCLATSITASVPAVGALVPNLGGLCGANIIQLINLNCLLSIVCKDVPAA